MANYEAIAPEVDISAVARIETVYTLEDGARFTIREELGEPRFGVRQTREVLTAAQRDAKYRPRP